MAALMRSSTALALIGLATNSVTPASRASHTRLGSEWLGHHDDRQIGVRTVGPGPDQSRERDAVHRKHVEVDDGQIDGVSAENFVAGRSVGGFMDGAHACRMQDGDGDGAHVLTVVHQQNVEGL